MRKRRDGRLRIAKIKELISRTVVLREGEHSDGYGGQDDCHVKPLDECPLVGKEQLWLDLIGLI